MDRDEQREFVRAIRSLFDLLVEEGFDDCQAMEIVVACVQANGNG